MSNREKSRLGRTARSKAKLRVRESLIIRTEVMEIIKYRRRRFLSTGAYRDNSNKMGA